MEVSVWLGGKTQKSVYGASCVQDADAGRVRSVGTSCEGRGCLFVVGQQVLVRQQLPRLCGYLDVVGVVVGGR